MPSAKLFSDLDKLVEGDIFVLNILDETLTYQVDQIRIVEPSNLSDLQIVPGKDYCTLVTCTPYGVNTHRMLVRGHRVNNAQGDVKVVADAIQYETFLIAPIVAVPILLILIVPEDTSSSPITAVSRALALFAYLNWAFWLLPQ